MIISENIRELVGKNVSTNILREEAIKEGMQLLKHDGLAKVCQGITTIDEILRAASA